MEKYIKDFPNHILNAVEIAREIKIKNIDVNRVKNILLCGLGGSGIGGTILKNFAIFQSPVTIDIVKDFTIPKSVSQETLVILSSYSGNTEETLYCMKSAIEYGAQIIVVSSGGQLLESAQKLGYDVFQVPSGFQPRAALAYPLVMLMNIFSQLGYLPEDINSELLASSQNLINNQEKIISRAVELADQIAGKLPIIYSEAQFEGVATRWRQQFNENAKMPCYSHVVPELNHNELVAMSSFMHQMHFVLLRHDYEHVKNAKAFDFIKSELTSYNAPFVEVWVSEDSLLKTVFAMIHLGDWTSFYLSQRQNVDPNKVEIIDKLKQFMVD